MNTLSKIVIAIGATAFVFGVFTLPVTDSVGSSYGFFAPQIAFAINQDATKDNCDCSNDVPDADSHETHRPDHESKPKTKPKPACTISASPSSVNQGGSSSLAWSSSNATSASINQGIGSVSTAGSKSISNLMQTITYTLMVTGAGGSASCQTTVTVQIPPPLSPTCWISVSPHTIETGDSVTLSWDSTNGTSFSIDQGVGSVAESGSKSVHNVTSSRTYTLTVSGAGGTKTCSDSVTVHVPPPSAPVCTFSVHPSHITSGDSVMLTWTTENATSVSINQGVGSVALGGSKAVHNITTSRTFTLTATGPGGYVTCEDSVTVEMPQAPACTLDVSPTIITSGGSVTLTWTTDNATSVTIDQGVGSVSLDGSKAVHNITTSRTFKLTATGPGGVVKCFGSVSVTIPQPNAPVCAFDVSPATIATGGSTTLHWTTENATSVSINQGVGSVALGGSKAVHNITTSRTFTLTATGPGGSVTCEDTVTVETPQAPSCSIWADRTHIDRGQSTSLTWDSHNATSASLSSFGSVSTDGSRSVSPYDTTTYTLTVFNAQGVSATCNTTIHVDVEIAQAPSCWVNINQSQYNASYNYGSNYPYNYSAILSWGSTNATSAQISPNVGSVSTSGSQTVYPSGAQSYTLTVYGSGGSRTCSTQVNIPPPPPPPPVYTNLSCSIYASPNTVSNGQGTNLTWNSTGATNAWISEGIGSVSPNGSRWVNPDGSRQYTLTISDYQGRTQTCTTYVNVQNTIYPPYVSLTQIPYTGFGDNATLIASWMGLVLAAGFGIYAVRVLKPMNVLSFAFARSKVSARAEEKQENETEVDAAVRNFYTKDRMVVERTGNGAPRLALTRNF